MLQKFYGWYGKRTVHIVLAIVVLLLGYIIFQFLSPDAVVVVEEAPKSVVEVSTSGALQSDSTLQVIGVVEAKTQAKLQAEAGGRIVTLNVTLGQTVTPGMIIAQLENASERASLLQAEGFYEATKAGSAQSEISVTEAETRLEGALDATRATNQAAYTTLSDVLLNTVDNFYSGANSGLIGLKINGRGQTAFLNEERIAFREILTNWNKDTAVGNQTPAIINRIVDSRADVRRALNLIDTFIPLITDSANTSSFSDQEIEVLAAELSNSRARLVAVVSSLDAVENTVKDAVDGLAKAKLGASGGTTSASDAQVKQALGSLRAAQANFEKTIVRSPITGTVNQLSVRAGDFVVPGMPIAEVANNNGLEVTTYLAGNESNKLAVGDVVTLGDNASGTVTNISPAVDVATGKIEVRIGVTAGDLKAGDTVKVMSSKVATSDKQEIIIPLSAIKLGTNNAFVFIVNAESKLEAKEVVLGPVSGDRVIVRSGIDLDTPIVLDVRGLKAGEGVVVSTK